MSFNNIPGLNSRSSNGGTSNPQTLTMSYNIMCVIGFIVSLASIILIFCFFTFSVMSMPIFLGSMFFLGLAALIVSIIGVSTFNKMTQLGFGFGLTGLISSSVIILVSVVLSILMLTAGALLVGTSAFLSIPPEAPLYTGPQMRVDNCWIRLEGTAEPYKTKAMLTDWLWSGDPSDNVIEMPDTYQIPDTNENITICAIGETNASSFIIRIDPSISHYVTLTEDAVKDSKAYVSAVPEGTIIHFSEVEFTLKVGKNIQMVNIDDSKKIYGLWNEDGSITYYHLTIKYECSSMNPYFYAKDGLLYKRGSDKPVTT